MTITRAPRLPRFDALDPALLLDPYPRYDEIRSETPVCRAGAGTFAVTRHRDVSQLMRDPRLGSEFPEAFHEASAGSGEASTFMHNVVLYRDPPDHTRLRKLLGQAFTPSIARSLRGRIVELVDGLLDDADQTGAPDIIRDLAFPLPVMVVCELMGLPAADRDLIRPHARDLGKAFAAIVPDEDRALADHAIAWLRGYLSDALDERRRAPTDDLLSAMLAATDGDDRLETDEIVDNAIFSFFAGFETTQNLIGNGVAALLDHPDQLDRLHGDRSLVPTAVDEFLRYDAPIQGVARYTREPMDIAGHRVRADRAVILLIGSANHDPDAFENPAGLDVGRTPNPHVAFGGGVHHCLGAILARIEAGVVFERLLERYSTWTPGGERIRSTSGSFRAYASIPVSFD